MQAQLAKIAQFTTRTTPTNTFHPHKDYFTRSTKKNHVHSFHNLAPEIPITTMSKRMPCRIPCPGCGKGSFIPGSAALSTHFNSWCSKSLLKNTTDVSPSSNSTIHCTPPRLALAHDKNGNPIQYQSFVQSRHHVDFEISSSEKYSSDLPIDHSPCKSIMSTPINPAKQLELEFSPTDEFSSQPPLAHTATPTSSENPLTKRGDTPAPDRTIQIEGSYRFQIELMDILQRHNTDLGIHDEIINLLDGYLRYGRINATCPNLCSRKKFISTVEADFKTRGMKPRHINVPLSDGSNATVSVFDIEHMILSLITDESLMNEENLAEGYDIFTGKVEKNNPKNKKYGEIHTGDSWKPVCKHYCGSKGKNMPIALVVFGDKSHTDLHGSLACTPIIFTLTLFNRSARMNPSFWSPIAYLPNLQHGKGKSDNTQSSVKVQDKQNV